MKTARQSSFINYVKSNPDRFTFVKPGDLVEGTVIDKGARALLVDLGKYGTGVVYRGELINARDTLKDAEVGNTIQAKVLEVDNDEGYIELSLSAAERQKSWLEVEELQGKEEVFSVEITGANKGGLLADVAGLKAFLPASQLSNEHYPDVEDNDQDKIESALQELVGTSLEVKIIDANPRMNKLIISEKAALQESVKELAKNYEVGQDIEGIVSGVADFGVFVKFTDNPEVEGLIHVSELDHRVIENPKEVVNIDDTVTAKIIDIKDGKISLSLKALQADPWETAAPDYKEGKEVSGTVYAISPVGAIINLDDGLQGHVHITDFGSLEAMKEKLTVGEKYTFSVKEFKPEEKKMSLSLVS